ncbi:MAG: hypothetical protein JNK05_20775 [Myxococcales bacterium]|nr:hypothetical protein [Myxococcales bacterium]
MLRLRAASRVQPGLERKWLGVGVYIDPRGSVCALFDAMGGQGVSEVGAHETCAFFEKTPFEPTEPEREDDALRAHVSALDERLWALNDKSVAYTFGVSIDVLACVGPHVALAHAGLTASFAVREQQIEQLTFAHDLRSELQRVGNYSKRATELMRTLTNVVVNSLGPNFPRSANTTRRVDTVLLPAVQGDRYVLVTPGITDVLEPSLIEATLREHTDDDLACEALVRAALERGSPRDLSALVATLVRA